MGGAPAGQDLIHRKGPDNYGLMSPTKKCGLYSKDSGKPLEEKKKVIKHSY
jgi:hypothetical protein